MRCRSGRLPSTARNDVQYTRAAQPVQCASAALWLLNRRPAPTSSALRRAQSAARTASRAPMRAPRPARRAGPAHPVDAEPA
eukprot:6609646-Prymnesium_polylepis.1